MRRFAALQMLLMVAGPLASRGAYAQDPLQDWDPGVSSSSSSFEILQPTELAVVPHSQALWVSLRTGNTHAYPFPGEQSMMTVEVEKGVDVQSGVLVGDVPGPNKPYITKWQSVKVFSVPVYENCDWLGTNPYSQVAPHSCKFQVPGYLSAEKLRVGQHQAGFYRIRAVVTGFGSSAWRMFRVPGVFQDVKAPLSFPSKAELTCAIFLPDEEWGVMSPYPDGSKVDIKDESRDIHYFVENKALGVAKDFTVRRSLTRQSDRVRIGQRRRMNAKTETLSLEGKVGTSSPKVGFTFHEQVQLAVGETAVVRGWMAVDSENAVDETNETNNSCSYQITIHRVE